MSVSSKPLKILVLAGGPDRERPVSLLGGAEVAKALRDAGHETLERDILPDDLSALHEFNHWQGDVVFPVLHGLWGEGGGLQRILSDRDLAYVGSGPAAASLCINKHLTKLTVANQGVATPESQLILTGQARTLDAPVVIKALEEGSTFGLAICKTEQEADAACERLGKDYPRLLGERYIQGKELTIGIIEDESGQPIALPPIQIIPVGECYDYNAKYESDDTQYRFDIDLSEETLQQARDWALAAHRALGVRHLCRVDFMVDEFSRPWFIEANTMPGFTTHSLLPMAAHQSGLNLTQLTNRLVHLAASSHGVNNSAPG